MEEKMSTSSIWNGKTGGAGMMDAPNQSSECF
jgi:hypothetical protein